MRASRYRVRITGYATGHIRSPAPSATRAAGVCAAAQAALAAYRALGRLHACARAGTADIASAGIGAVDAPATGDRARAVDIARAHSTLHAAPAGLGARAEHRTLRRASTVDHPRASGSRLAEYLTRIAVRAAHPGGATDRVTVNLATASDRTFDQRPALQHPAVDDTHARDDNPRAHPAITLDPRILRSPGIGARRQLHNLTPTTKPTRRPEHQNRNPQPHSSCSRLRRASSALGPRGNLRKYSRKRPRASATRPNCNSKSACA